MCTLRFIFRLFKRFIVLTILLGLGWTYFNNPQFQQTANASIWQVRQRIISLIGKHTAPATSPNAGDTGEITDRGKSAASSSNSQENKLGQVPTIGRWPSDEATVFVGTGNQILNDATNDAIQAWNRSGVFHFQTTNDRNKANIVVQAMNNGRTNAAGLTEQSSSPITNRFIHADVYLNQRYLLDPVYGYSHDRIVNTAEHELGHAIGLDHTNLPSVMQPAGSYYPIQSVDVQAVKQLYA